MNQRRLFWFEAPDFAGRVFFAGLFEVNAADIGKGAKPGEDVGELLSLVFLVIACQCGRKLADFLDKPEKCSGNTSLAVAFFILLGNELLKFFDLHRYFNMPESGGRFLHGLRDWSEFPNVEPAIPAKRGLYQVGQFHFRINALGGIDALFVYLLCPGGEFVPFGVLVEIELASKWTIDCLDDFEHRNLACRFTHYETAAGAAFASQKVCPDLVYYILTFWYIMAHWLVMTFML